MTTNIQTYDVNELTLSTTDPTVTQLQLAVSSSLMTNYEPSRPVDSQNSIDVAEDVNGNPMFFSIGTANELYVICRSTDPTAPWTQTDLTSGLGTGWQVQTFRLLQVPQGSIYLVVVIKDSNSNIHFYITAALPNDPSNSVWTGDFTSQWVERAFSESFTSIDHILMCGGATASAPPSILATASQANGLAERYYVNGDTTVSTGLWTAFSIPQNATNVIDIAIGTEKILGPGSFLLYQVGTTLQLDFTFTLNGQTFSRSLTPPDGAMALATLQNSDGTTDLYVAGNGIYVFTSSNMGANATATQIGSTINAGTGTEMVVRQDSSNIAVWVLDQGLLYYLQGTKGTTVQWTAPLAVQQNVGQIAALRNTVRDTNELFLVTADEQLAYLYQDPATSMWNEMVLPLADTGSVLPIQCYTTQITLTDQNNNPVTKGFTISASEWAYLTVNGSACIVDQNTAEAITPDPTGSITIISKVSTPATPTIYLAGDFFTEVVDINPQSVINNNLVQFTTESALTTATTQSGEQLISGTTQISVATAASALQQLTTLTGATGSASGVATRTADQPPSNLVNTAVLPQNFGFGVSGVGTGADTFHDSTTAAVALPHLAAHGMRAAAMVAPQQALITTDAGDELTAFFGDVMVAIENALDQAGQFLLQVANDVAAFTIQLANSTVSFILDSASKVMRVIGWVLQQIAIPFEKLIDWLGFIFNWDDIITAHKIMVNVANKSFELAETKLVDAETIVSNFFDTLKTQLDGLAPMTDSNASATVLSRSQNPAPTFSASQTQQANYLKSPGGNFAKYHLQHSGILNATPPTTPPSTTPPSTTSQSTTPASGNPIVDMFTQVIEPVGKDIGDTIENVFTDMRNGFVSGTLTPNQALAQMQTDGVKGALQTAEDASVGVLKVADDLVTSIQGQINNQWDIPFLSALYSEVTGGSPLTLLDAMALLIAIPGVPMYKLAAETSPFANGTFGLDDSTTDAATFFSTLSGQSATPPPPPQPVHAVAMPMTMAAAVATLDPPTETDPMTAAILYSQIGGCFFIAAEVVSMTVSAIDTEADGETPAALNYIALAAETVMQAGSFPVGDGPAVALLRLLWGLYIVALLRFVALIIGKAAAEPAVGVFEIFFALVKGIIFLGAIVVQTAKDTGTELALEWETFFGNLIDATSRGFSGAAKIDPDKEITGLGLDAIAVWLSVFAIAFDAVRMSIVLGEDGNNEYHSF